MALAFETAGLTATTDASGYFDYWFVNPIDQVMVTPASPLAGTNAGLVSAAAEVTGDKSVRVRVWVTSTDWTVKPAANQQVTVTLLGIRHV